MHEDFNNPNVVINPTANPEYYEGDIFYDALDTDEFIKNYDK